MREENKSKTLVIAAVQQSVIDYWWFESVVGGNKGFAAGLTTYLLKGRPLLFIKGGTIFVFMESQLFNLLNDVTSNITCML